jgi:hypothetical protein
MKYDSKITHIRHRLNAGAYRLTSFQEKTMNTNLKRTMHLSFAFIGSLVLLAGVLALAGQVSHAAPSGQGTVFIPVITITQPAPNTILTHTPQLVTIEYNCGAGTLCLGTNQISAVSVTVNADAGPYYAAAPAFSGTLGGSYTYAWSLGDQDYVVHKLRARARNGWGDVGTSAPITVYVDTIPPRQNVITAPAYTENTSFTISWSASDGSGQVRYNLQYRRDDQPSWTEWLTDSQATSQMFIGSAQMVQEGHYYAFRMRARDRANNQSDWVTATTRVGRYYLYLPFIAHGFPPPWRQGAGSQSIRFRTPSACGSNTWYAGTSNTDGVWKSTDSAQTWHKVADLQPFAYPVVANPANCNDAFVSVWGEGIYRLSGTAGPMTINDDLDELYVYGLALSNATLYAGTFSQGVYKTNINNVNWQPVNNGIRDRHIRSLHVQGTNLYAGGRDCNVYVSPNGGGSWEEQTLLTTDCDDAPVRSVLEVEGTLYAGLGQEKGLYYLDGETWGPVTAIPTGTVNGLAYDDVNGNLYVSVYGAGICRCPVEAGGKVSDCSNHDLALLSLDTWEVRLHNNQLVIGSDDGVWYRTLIP